MRKALRPASRRSPALMFVTAPIIIARAPYESTMGLVQKIFYFHVPPAMLMLLVGHLLRHRQRASFSSRSGRSTTGWRSPRPS